MDMLEGFDSLQEKQIYNKLKYYLSDENLKLIFGNSALTSNDSKLLDRIFQLKRLKTKLELRQLKRKNQIKQLDLDCYVNELIDRERNFNLKLTKNYVIKQEPISIAKNDDNQETKNDKIIYDHDVIFEYRTLKTNINETDSSVEIVEINLILDRFNDKKLRLNNTTHLSLQTSIGLVEFRNEDVKCVFSPFSNKFLKPFIWRDFITLPIKLELNNQILKKNENNICSNLNAACIDYVHLRPEHVIPINLVCREYFWNGIDISECLQYPDYTIVALYKKLIVGFAFVVPSKISQSKEAYLSFIFVHPDWRKVSRDVENGISIGRYMLFYLIKASGNCDITLHVSVNSPAVVFYQKFGFKIEEFIKNFYDKYYPEENNLSKDSFLMRLVK